METTETKIVNNAYTQLTTGGDYLVQCNYGDIIVHVGANAPDNSDPGIIVNKSEVMTSGILTGTLWGKSRGTSALMVTVAE